MKSKIIFILLLIVSSIAILSCNEPESYNILPPDSSIVTYSDVGYKLQQWSEEQTEPFIIFQQGDTSSGKLHFQNDLVSNIALDSLHIGYFEYYDSLFVNTGYESYVIWKNYQGNLKPILDSIDLSFTEYQMSEFLSHYSLQLRMMKYDSLTSQLHQQLLKWSKHQYPPQRIRSGFYSFVDEGANFGGYSRTIFSFKGVQSLQFFTRKISSTVLTNIINSIDTSLTKTQLKNLINPIAYISFADTEFGIE